MESLPDGPEDRQKICQKTAGGSGGLQTKRHLNAHLPIFHHGNIFATKSAEKVARKRPPAFAISDWSVIDTKFLYRTGPLKEMFPPLDFLKT